MFEFHSKLASCAQTAASIFINPDFQSCLFSGPQVLLNETALPTCASFINRTMWTVHGSSLLSCAWISVEQMFDYWALENVCEKSRFKLTGLLDCVIFCYRLLCCIQMRLEIRVCVSPTNNMSPALTKLHHFRCMNIETWSAFTNTRLNSLFATCVRESTQRQKA